MIKGYDIFLIRDLEEGHEFIFVNSSRGTTPMRDGSSTYNDVVAFPAKTFRGESGVSYPVIYEDFSAGAMRQETRKTSYDTLPDSIKRRFERWRDSR
tara:strand:- start:393 stop:683 length:291 start_codon:yes stop_codon:yes gene_type:complete